MGSNLGPTMAGFSMAMIESRLTNRPLMYYRYVDDVFALFKTANQAKKYLKYLNTFHKNIQFTLEEEKENKINFLDVTIKRIDSRFELSWHLKDTNTGVYVPRTACSPMKYKKNAIKEIIFVPIKLHPRIQFSKKVTNK